MKTMKASLLSLFVLFGIISMQAQEKSSSWTLSSYLDTYYGYFTDETPGLQKFTTVSPRSKHFGLNVAQIGLQYESDIVRSNVILHYGDIMEATWSSTFSPVQEANIGLHVVKDWWLDMGFFATHIGTESFLPKNNDLSSTAFATYNEPFYQAGAKLAYEGSKKFDFEFWVVNGYNYFLDANSAKSVGILFTYNIADHSSITYTNLFGRESMDTRDTVQYRTYHNLYLNSEITEKLKLTLGGDFGSQTNSVLLNQNETAYMYNALATLRYQFTKAFSVTGRYERFSDPDGFISGVVIPGPPYKGLSMQGFTIGTEYKPSKESYLRLESRYVVADEGLDIFYNDSPTNERIEVLVTMGYIFEKKL